MYVIYKVVSGHKCGVLSFDLGLKHCGLGLVINTDK